MTVLATATVLLTVLEPRVGAARVVVVPAGGAVLEGALE